MISTGTRIATGVSVTGAPERSTGAHGAKILGLALYDCLAHLGGAGRCAVPFARRLAAERQPREILRLDLLGSGSVMPESAVSEYGEKIA